MSKILDHRMKKGVNGQNFPTMKELKGLESTHFPVTSGNILILVNIDEVAGLREVMKRNGKIQIMETEVLRLYKRASYEMEKYLLMVDPFMTSWFQLVSTSSFSIYMG